MAIPVIAAGTVMVTPAHLFHVLSSLDAITRTEAQVRPLVGRSQADRELAERPPETGPSSSSAGGGQRSAVPVSEHAYSIGRAQIRQCRMWSAHVPHHPSKKASMCRRLISLRRPAFTDRSCPVRSRS
jgi:hypothetical protein